MPITKMAEATDIVKPKIKCIHNNFSTIILSASLSKFYFTFNFKHCQMDIIRKSPLEVVVDSSNPYDQNPRNCD